MTIHDGRMVILRKVESGEISTEDGSRMLEELEMGEAQVFDSPSPQRAPIIPDQQVAISEPKYPDIGSTRKPELTDLEQSRFNFWQKWWLLPFSLGVALTLLGAYWMYLGLNLAGLGWGFWLSWIPFGSGVVLTAAAARSRSARWLHVRVHNASEKKGKTHNINISFPLPFSFIRWVTRTFGRWMPGHFNKEHLDEMLAMLDQAIAADAPFHVMVNEDNGDEVEVFIG